MQPIPDQHRSPWPETTRPISDPSDYDAAIAAFGRTYKTHENPLAIVDLYQAVLEYRADHPNAGSHAVASALGVPRSRIQRWVDEDAVPYVVQGIQTVEDRGWLPLDHDRGARTVWARLIAWVFASGSIKADRWSPQFVADTETDARRLRDYLWSVGCETTEPDEPGTGLRGTVLSPTPDGSVLGRVLAVLGAPVGAEKREPGLRPPPWLAGRAKVAFGQEYVRLRCRDTDGEHGSFGEDRGRNFRARLIGLLREVTGERVVATGEHDIYLSAAAMDALDLTD